MKVSQKDLIKLAAELVLSYRQGDDGEILNERLCVLSNAFCDAGVKIPEVKEYCCTVSGTYVFTTYIQVCAQNIKDAKEKAIDIASDEVKDMFERIRWESISRDLHPLLESILDSVRESLKVVNASEYK